MQPAQDLKNLREVIAKLGKDVEVPAPPDAPSLVPLMGLRMTTAGNTLTAHQDKSAEAASPAVCLQEQQLCINGHNWGDVAIEGQTLKFRVGQQPAFRIPLQDVGQVQQSREEVRMHSQPSLQAGCDLRRAQAVTTCHGMPEPC